MLPLIITPSFVLASTVVNKNILTDTTWTKAGSPYIVYSYIYVYGNSASGATLTLEPGVEVRFNQNSSLQIGQVVDKGALVAAGTRAEPIVFTANVESPYRGYWNGIHFNNGTMDDKTIMEHCVVEYAGNYDLGGIYINSSSPTIRNCRIRESSSYGIYCIISSALIERNIISSNNDYGIFITGSEAPDILGSDIYNNKIGVYFDGSDSIQVNCNKIHNNLEYDIYNNSTYDIDARLIWWGEDVIDEIGEGGNPKDIGGIYDRFDDTSKGTVDYADWLLKADEDGDGFMGCEGDCVDNDPDIYPGAPELCDGKDNDCNGSIDEGEAEGCTPYYLDKDNDGYGVVGFSRCLCNSQGYYSTDIGGDCDDTNPAIKPKAPEVCNKVDDDCDSAIDEDCIGLCAATIRVIGQVIGDSVNVSNVYIGMDTNAWTLPAYNPPFDYTVYLEIFDGLLYDFRQVGSEYEEWNLIVKVEDSADPNQAGFFPVLTWDPNEFCSPDLTDGYFELYVEDTQGNRTLLVEDMSEANQYQTREEDGQCALSSGRCIFSYYIAWAKSHIMEMNLPSGWSMISLPLKPQNPFISSLFREAMVAYGYEKGIGYVDVKAGEDLEVGKGYWIFQNDTKGYTIIGRPIPNYAYPVDKDGWYMIGGCTSPAKVSSKNCTIGAIYGYVKGVGYQRVPESEDLESGRGYWIMLENVADKAKVSVLTSGSTP